MIQEFTLTRTVLTMVEPTLLRTLILDTLPTSPPKENVLEKDISEEDKKPFLAYLNEREAADKPMVMVFGVYNAGKSTLINALLGEKVAEVSARPQTDKITPYDWEGFTLCDTPGIDAPEDHEHASRKHQERCDVILFVLWADGTFDERKTYEEICTLLKVGKPLRIILNTKGDVDNPCHFLMEIQDKIVQNLQKIAPEFAITDIEKRAQLRLINAKRAFLGRSTGEPVFVETSGLPKLVDDLRDFLRQSGAMDRAWTCNRKLEAWIDLALKKLSTDKNDKGLGEAQAAVEGERSRMVAAMTMVIMRETVIFRESFRSAVEEQRQGAAQAAANRVNDEFNKAFEREMTVASARLADIGKQLEMALPASVQANAFLKERPPGPDRETEKMIQALKLGKTLLPTLLGKLGLGGMLGKALPWVGVAIDGAVAIFEWFNAQDANKEAINAQRRRDAAIAEKVEDAAKQVQKELTVALNFAIDQIFSPITDKLSKEAKTLGIEQLKREGYREILMEAKRKLDEGNPYAGVLS